MSFPVEERVLALAGIAQALQQVRRIAETGQSEASVVRTLMDSVFRIDAATPAAVYGDVSDLAPGLRLLNDYFNNRAQDAVLPRLALAVLQLERRFVKTPATARAVAEGIERTAPLAREAGDSGHPDVLSALGKLYADTISHLRPRVMVQGNPHYLGQAGVVSEIRALLLAAMRSAVLWRQLGGSYWDFLFAKRAMAEAVARALR
ncbi:high frequency lysogenization protein HflD [Stenotrophomonas sp. MMGLT7]|uniref:high frequency lysogenization protein HflD n=1 Tax=Stenotrophomonas sp. MMGLT7 TaxID=2901227 RepID=UPI001E456C62|nr:high frequency lysogenization protein HflD [Stenotrophomonas sp. MMGLT7]MCD7100233.1 high frequency lysogenization protein HflD [Stenotrophomonas sp. MMGLT7]